MKIYRDAEGKCVNIGEWDYCIAIEQHVARNGDGVEMLDDDGNVVVVDVEVIRNPMPPNLTASDEEVVTGWDGGLYVHNDPRKDGPQ